ncbi:MAG: phenylalanine--tRNA ligase subunit beta [Candidatus Gastranaerophilales bacterium]|nr:phenylalanine--tRNA ligase subunit beta [Candidatus Gastranaerophilales bacterium]
MQVSHEWLNEFVDLEGITPEEVAHNLTMSGLEVEEIEYKKPQFTNIRTAKIIKIDNHPNADKLHLVTLDIAGIEKCVVCGAQNIEIGQIIPYASVGSKVLDRKTGEQFELTPAVIRGVESRGMLCSQDELGLSGMQEEDGILILNRLFDNVELNQPLEKVLNLSDEIIYHVAPTANRGDEMSVIGIARELSALFNRKMNFKKPEIENKPCDFKVEIIDDETCKYYSVAVLKNLTIKPSPDFIQRRVIAGGMRPINNIVDITNYVMLEYGTPQHAFDYDKLQNYLCVRYAHEGEKLITIDETERKLTDKSVVIATKDVPVCAAGVFGGLNSEIDSNTKNIALEGAYFTSHTNRKSARSIGYHSDASSRYERGIDIEMVNCAINHSIELLQKYANAEFIGISKCGCDKLEDIEITLRNSEIKRIMGVEIPQSRSVEILENLGFELLGKNETAAKFKVPSWRYDDVKREIDLIEEVTRIDGFDKVSPSIPNISQGCDISLDTRIVKTINQTMLSYGFDEIITSSLIGKNLCNQFLEPIDETCAIKVKNPHSEDFAILRQTLYPNLLEVVKNNFDNSQKNFRLYEIGKTYIQKSAPDEDNSGALETRKLSGCIFGSVNNSLINSDNNDFFTLKGVLESLFEKLNLTKRIVYSAFSENDAQNYQYLHPAQSATISILGKNKNVIGYIGRLHPVLADKLKFNQNLYIFEINLEDVIEAVNLTTVKYKKLPQTSPIQRDIAFIAPKEVTNEDINKVIKKSADKNIFKSSRIFDIYEGENIEEGKKSFAYRITLQDENKTLTDEIIQAEINKIKSGLEKNIIGLILR